MHIVHPLLSPVTVHPIGIDHQLELLILPLKGIDELESILKMHIVIPCTVS